MEFSAIFVTILLGGSFLEAKADVGLDQLPKILKLMTSACDGVDIVSSSLADKWWGNCKKGNNINSISGATCAFGCIAKSMGYLTKNYKAPKNKKELIETMTKNCQAKSSKVKDRIGELAEAIFKNKCYENISKRDSSGCKMNALVMTCIAKTSSKICKFNFKV